MAGFLQIHDRKIGPEYSPFVVAEIGINHEGDVEKAKQMVRDAKKSGAECVKFQMHVLEDEMAQVAKKIVPVHTKESIWEIMERCGLTRKEHEELKSYTEAQGMIYLSTPFSRAAADILNEMGVLWFKIGSGECNNYPLVEHVAAFGKPIILSTGMNDIPSVAKSVAILRGANVPFALMHCTSLYPTPYEKVRLGGITELKNAFPDAVVGLSDHSVGIYTCLGAVPFGASILEKHFTSDRSWPGPDIAVSIDPQELRELIVGSEAIYKALGGHKEILKEEQPTIDFAYACVVSIQDIKKGGQFTKENIWVKRPGTGEIKAADYYNVVGKVAARDIRKDTQITWDDVGR
ncbi:polyhydroxyalkanoate biosynthesis repressor PhaR [Candidatus Uhrbacteria bacterium RIFCSPLOWO2_01_FULL_47_24]|uniref:Polyhydroxyalkanoate biosynthesis repressor PhaR n=1 Tax=Candidatus Uhrbacteria bacterium RIFCSPLOWO2_01_FULL_47_24 TaxID=1802401 RepID=A0A1F7USS6_9BACT|nr:MAG: polyhydroxyalkanoate biosynthesis repressor PhaR [Candidatus Uhrbacteria bacterium RIFCSPHIGHO2_01_FULL_47_11]OGL69037.1 MAG: polyhydroxyalkanoate biosynthesis repressor PhaR [Candidatus Uhrbacteria bacterium RIFCSPHIGHO2_02_FULL_46_47]OGL76307.1 MAG: polyhydroxyalkanoate biosynthesis repressor PhaR [Candidatus Uhrbacteria bacterium RIFCSPHIGHO2_12_FULL_47_11]OGL81341.1 MAG: polyhydroxyalkanoate biosynthesis repressor PhaR [Candidatus Uhrbacteria bacterium RIFCSPLOWO2_01_FULL_47_24]OGL8